MAEYILREQAIIAVTGAKLPDVSASGLPIANGKRSVTDCVRRLKDIPAADVRPVVRGKWIAVTNGRGGNECSVCHDYAPSFQNGSERLSNFCPNCGADMRENG